MTVKELSRKILNMVEINVEKKELFFDCRIYGTEIDKLNSM